MTTNSSIIPADPINNPITSNPTDQINQSSSWLTRQIKWLRADDEQEPLFALAKTALAVFLALLLTISVFGIPVVWRGYEIWQELAELRDNNNNPHNINLNDNNSLNTPHLSQIPSTFTKNPFVADFEELGICLETHDKRARIFHSKLLFEGTQEGCKGSISISEAEAVRKKLEDKKVEGITFNSENLTDKIEGGTCTSMSLKFTSCYFKTKEVCKKDPNYQPKMLLDKLSLIGHKFASSSDKMKNRQAAYNTIETKNIEGNIDYSKNKVQALANDRSLKINFSSKEIEVDYYHENIETISKEIDNLPEGVFLLRILKPKDNKKLEDHGHTLVYIKEEGIGLFYDPNLGVVNLSPKEHSDLLTTCMLKNLNDFEINKARFYQVQPE